LSIRDLQEIFQGDGMKAQDLALNELLQGAKQFVVPIFQRTYSWGTQHCEQLLKDILRIGRDDHLQAHFLGSVVYVADSDHHGASIPRWQVIDGQQRLTTVLLLLVVLCEGLKINPDAVPDVTVEQINDYYLKNPHGKGEMHYKLLLTQKDRDALIKLFDGQNLDGDAPENILENLDFFRNQLQEEDLKNVYKGFMKLKIVDVALTRGQDDPQMIFESLNSTGLDLTQADLIRNFVLMRQPPDQQTALYKTIWHPMESRFGNRFGTDFDKFVRAYLTLRTQPSRPIRADAVYQEYKNYFFTLIQEEKSVAEILGDLGQLAEYFTRCLMGKETDTELKEVFSDLSSLVEVAAPLMLCLYELYEKDLLNKGDFAELIRLLESYVFRRSVCDMQTRSLGQIFSSLTYRIREKAPTESLKVSLARMGKRRRFPSDSEFRESLVTRDMYGLRNCRFLLDRLENDSKEKIDTSSFTIEHVMPQNPELSPEWREALGPDWKNVQETWVHRLGNLTLTGYNEKYSDAAFKEKKTMKDGFNDSPLRLNKFIREQNTWNETLIEQRGGDIADHALKLWGGLCVDKKIVQRYALEEKKQRASQVKLEDVIAKMTPGVATLFKDLQERLLSLGGDVTEILDPKNVTYHVYEYFVQVIPRADGITLVLNLEFEEAGDDTGFCRNAADRSFFINAPVRGGVYIQIYSTPGIDKAMLYLRNAYEKASE